MATQRKKARGYVDANLYVADVESIALRNDGDETQPALAIKTRTGFIVVRCIGRPGVVPRFVDLRGADKKRRRRRKELWVSVPMSAIEAHPTKSLNARAYVPMTSDEAERVAVAREAARDAREDR